MRHEVEIRELHGIEQLVTIFPLYAQSATQMSESTFLERLTDMQEQGNYRCICAYLGDRLVGVSGFWTGTQLWCGKYLEPDHVVIDATLRSGGIGAQLMAWLEAEGERIGCRLIRVTMVLGKERTHKFYKSIGYFDDGLLLVKALSRGAEEYPEYVAPVAR